ncbi:hypothetical protein ASD93_11410 [Microbacterium sp. Root180]|nr:hypothetical protein ASD93_11410 [Microbacterium sp. Root180]
MVNEKKRQLVFVHGRSQQGRDPVAAKKEWVDALREGLRKAGRELPIDETDIRFPFYGDTLIGMIEGRSGDDLANVIVMGTEEDDRERRFLEAVLREVKDQAGVTDEQVREVNQAELVEMGIQNSAPVLALLRAINEYLPGLGGALISAVTHDVYVYLHNGRIAERIDDGVSEAMSSDRENVVVAHSLGSVVAYRLISERARESAWKVPRLITVGSPLGIRAINGSLGATRHPAAVGEWMNAYDPADVVALRPLSAPWFAVDPAVKNNGGVDNEFDDHHGIRGYLGDPAVAEWVYQALTAP